jgi:hypothetical protein
MVMVWLVVGLWIILDVVRIKSNKHNMAGKKIICMIESLGQGGIATINRVSINVS